MRIIVDAMGGDNAPLAPVDGAIQAAEKLGVEPLEFALRDQVGIRVKPEELTGLAERLKQLLENE